MEFLIDHKFHIVIFVSIFAVLALIFFLYIHYKLSFKGSPFMDYACDSVEPNGYFERELDKCCVYFAKGMMTRNRSKEFDLYYEKVRHKIKPLFLRQVSLPNHTFVDVLFSENFLSFVRDKYEDATVGDFQKIARSYVKFVHRQVPVIDHKIFESNQDIINASDNESEVFDSEKDALVKRLIITAYNSAVKDIRLHDNKGLIPFSSECLAADFFSFVCNSKVYTYQRLMALFSDSSDETLLLDTLGCYVVFNTYNEKYFIGKSDNMFSCVHSLFLDSDADICLDLQADIQKGHLLLVKFIRLVDTSYEDCDHMHHDLVLAYCSHFDSYNDIDEGGNLNECT